MKILFLFKWSHRPLQLCELLNIEWLLHFEHSPISLWNVSFLGECPFLPHLQECVWTLFNYSRRLSISSLHVLQYSFYTRYKWVLVNVSMACGNICGENHHFVEKEPSMAFQIYIMPFSDCFLVCQIANALCVWT